jgi:signal transduction histidine kinase/ligand-binding sensor domain-containing protein
MDVQGHLRNYVHLRPVRSLLFISISLLCAAHIALCVSDTSDTWVSVSGLPQGIVRAIRQGPDGYLWIATMDGLARFDGVRMTVFNRGNTPGFAANRLESLYVSPNGHLWMSTESGRVILRSDGKFRTLTQDDGIPLSHVHGLAGDGAGNVRILIDGALYERKVSATRFERMQSVPGNLYFRPLMWNPLGFWAQDGNRVIISRFEAVKALTLPTALGVSEIWGMALAADGTYWLELSNGRRLHIGEDGKFTDAGDAKRPLEINYKLGDGSGWPLYVTSHLIRTMLVDGSSSAQPIAIIQLYRDHEGTAWLGTNGYGLFHQHHQFIRTISRAQGLAGPGVYPILQTRDGAVWIGAWPGGLSRYAGGVITNYSVKDGLLNPLVTALAEDSNRTLWVGTHGGLIVRQGNKFVPSKVTLPVDGTVQAILQSRDGTIWFGTTQGLVSWKNGASRILTTSDGLQTNDVRVLLEDRNGDLWIGGYGGLTRMHNGAFTRWTDANGLPSENIRALYQDSDGTLWVGTYDNGLGRFQDGRWKAIRSMDGLGTDGVFQILDDGHGNFWLSSNHGIYRVRKSNLDDFAHGRAASVSAVSYGVADGMATAECNGGLSPAGVRANDGTLWFPTQNGVSTFDPAAAPALPEPPHVIIESATVNGQSVDLASEIKVPSGRSNIEVHYTAPNYINAAQIRFRYRIQGLDSDWSDAGTRRTAYITHLPPGDYVFQVMAGNSDGRWSDAVESLPIQVSAPFYLTWWFLASTCFCVFAAVVLAAAYRVRQAERARAAQRAFSMQLISSQESERKRIAAELHDSLGQRLVVMKNLALFFLRGVQKSEQKPEQLENIEEISTQASIAIEETRTISYNLRPFHLDRLGLRKAVEALVRTSSQAAGLEYEMQIDDIDHDFADDLQMNFYRIVQEALNNVAKHANASRVTVRVERAGHQVTMTVHDNGEGLDPHKAVSTLRGGFGLTGMRERANLLKGTITVQNDQHGGTTVRLTAPIQKGGDDA